MNYREIMRLRSLDHSQRQVAAITLCSRDTVSTVYKLADKHGLEWPLPEDWSNEKMRDLFYPGRAESKKVCLTVLPLSRAFFTQPWIVLGGFLPILLGG